MSIFLGLILAITSLLFAFQNNDLINVKFFKWHLDSSIALIVLAALVIGFMIGFLLLVPSLIRANLNIRRIKKENSDLNSRVDSSGITYESEGLGEEGNFKR